MREKWDEQSRWRQKYKEEIQLLRDKKHGGSAEQHRKNACPATKTRLFRKEEQHRISFRDIFLV